MFESVVYLALQRGEGLEELSVLGGCTYSCMSTVSPSSIRVPYCRLMHLRFLSPSAFSLSQKYSQYLDHFNCQRLEVYTSTRNIVPGASYVVRLFDRPLLLKIIRLPLEHIFTTASRVYRRSRLRPALSTWHASAVSETHRIDRQAKAANIIQNLIRTFLAGRVAKRHYRTRGPVAVAASRVIQLGFRAQQERRAAAERAVRWRKREVLREIHRQNETARENQWREMASITIQAAWRAVVGRVEGAERARLKLERVLVDLGGGQGRMHRFESAFSL